MITSFFPSATAPSRMSSKAESLAALTCSTAAVLSFPRKPPVSWDSRSSRVRMVSGCNLATGQFRIAFFNEAPVYPQGGRFQLYLPDHIGGFWQIQTFRLRCPVGNAVSFLCQLALHRFLQNRGMIAIAHHIKVTVAEGIEAVPVNGRVQNLYWLNTSMALLVITVPVSRSR